MTRIAPSPVTSKSPRVKDSDYMGYIASLGGEQGAGCLICEAKPCQVCHFRGGEPCELCEGTGCIVKGNYHHAYVDVCWHCNGTGWRYGKVDAMKNDRFTWPGCPSCHQYAKDAQHAGSEYAFWRKHGLDVLGIMHKLQTIWDSRKSDPDALERGTRAIQEVRK